VGVLGTAGLLSLLVTAISQAGPQAMKAVGRLIFTQYLLPFEVTSLLLLVAIVGAVVVAKQRI